MCIRDSSCYSSLLFSAHTPRALNLTAPEETDGAALPVPAAWARAGKSVPANKTVFPEGQNKLPE
eukprot:3571184-Pyramimonas_sp.AAC.1